MNPYRALPTMLQAGGDFETPLVVRLPFVALCWVLDIVYDNRPIQK